MNIRIPKRFAAPLNTIIAMLRPAETLDLEEALPRDTVYVATTDNLPPDGEADIKYHVVADGSIWRWASDAYHEVNPYVFGVEQKYRDAPRVIRPKALIIDPAAEMASLSLDQVRGGSSETLATLYNLYALRADLDMIKRLVIHSRTTLMEFLSNGPRTRPEDNASEWFHKEHHAMFKLLNSSIQYRDGRIWTHTPVVDALHKQGASLVWCNDRNLPLFKTGEFSVYL